MNQNRLVINQVAGANIVEYELDLYDDVPLPINKSIIDIQNIAERKSDFTKTITLPGTHNNNDIFSNIFNLARSVQNTNTYNFAPDFNPNLKADAILYKNGIAMIQGYLQLTNINIVDEYQIEYEVIIIGRTANLFQDLGEKKLNELDLSAYDHTWNYTNIAASWTPSAAIGYYYGLIDKGFSNDQKGFYTLDQKPQVFARTIIDAIFKDAGYRYASLFLTSGIFNKLVVPCTQDKLLLTTQQVTDRTFEADRIVNSGLISLPQSGFTVLPFNNIALQSTPAGYNSTTFIYTIPTGASGVYSFACNIDMTFLYDNFNSDNCGVDYRFLIKKGSSLLFQTGRDSTTITFPSQTIKTSFQSQEVFCSAGEQIEVQLFFENNTDRNNTFDLRLNTTSNFFAIVNANLTIGSTMQLEKCLPADIKQADFLASIIKMFNLYVSVDELDNKKLKIEPRDDYFTSDIVDLTNDIDVSRGVEVKPLGDLKYKDYTFAMAEDKDELNTLYQDQYKYPYGTKQYTVPNDFITESYKTEVVFAPTPLGTARNNSKVVFSQIIFKNSNNETIDSTSKLRLLVAGGLSPVIATNYFHYADPDGTRHDFSAYAYVGHYDNVLNPTFDINFDIPKQINYKNGYKTNQSPSTLYNVYHKKGIEEITNKDSKLVTYFVKLSEVEINKLSFRSSYFIDKQYYRLYEIDFDSNSEDPAKLTFLKLAVAPAFIPYNLVTNGGGGGEGSAYAQIANRNGTQYPKGVDVIGQGSDNTLQGYEQIVNSTGNFVNAYQVNILGGENNTVLNNNVTLINTNDYTSIRDGEVIINNIHQPYYASRVLTVAELQALHSTPIQILAAQSGYWIEVFRAYVTVFFGTTTPPTGYTRRVLSLEFAGDGTHLAEFDNSITTVTTATMQRARNINDTVFKDLAVNINAAGNLGAAGNSQMLIELEYRLHPIIQ
jgi:hypothetical protein